MSHCGPLTTHFLLSTTSLRICTPLLPLPSLRRTLKLISKSLYFFLLARKVLNFGSLAAWPTSSPFLYDQYSLISPSQPVNFSSRNVAGSSLSSLSARPTPTARATKASAKSTQVRRMTVSRKQAAQPASARRLG